MITAAMLLEICRANGAYRIPTQDMRSPVITDLRDQGLIEMGQELTDFVAAAFPGGIRVTGGVPNPLFVWVQLTDKGHRHISESRLLANSERLMIEGKTDGA